MGPSFYNAEAADTRGLALSAEELRRDWWSEGGVESLNPHVVAQHPHGSPSSAGRPRGLR